MAPRRALPITLALLLLGGAAWWMRERPARPVPPRPRAESPPVPRRAEPVASAAIEVAPPAAEGTGLIEGSVELSRVKDAPAPGVLVVLKREAQELRRATSGPDGRFRFEGLARGEYRFSTRSPGSPVWDHDHGTATIADGGRASVTLHVERPVPEGTGLPTLASVKFEDGRLVRSFSFTLWQEGGLLLVEGTDGRFQRALPGAGWYWVTQVVVDGLPCPTEPGWTWLAEDGTFAVTLPAPQRASLLVRDAATREPLASAIAIREIPPGDRPWDRDPFPCKGALVPEPLRADAEGVIDLGTRYGTAPYFVRAEGHAWRKVEATFADTDAMPVLLGPGGRVQAEVLRWAELEDPRVYLDEGPRLLPEPDGSGRVTWDGIPAGPQKFTVRRGYGREGGIVYAQGSAEVSPGETAVLVLQAVPVAVSREPITVRLRAPSGWSKPTTLVRLEGAEPGNASVDLEQAVDIPADGSVGECRTAPAPPGRYRLTVAPQSYHDVEVPAEGRTVEVVLPETVEVRVRVLDGESGAPATDARLSWYGHHPSRRSFRHDDAEPTGVPGEFRLWTPAGRVDLHAREPATGRRATESLAIELPGPVSAEVRIPRTGSARVTLTWTGAAPSWNEVRVRLHRGGMEWHSRLEMGVATIDGLPPGPGTVRVTLNAAEYEPVPPREVDVVADEIVQVEIPIVRKP